MVFGDFVGSVRLVSFWISGLGTVSDLILCLRAFPVVGLVVLAVLVWYGSVGLVCDLWILILVVGFWVFFNGFTGYRCWFCVWLGVSGDAGFGLGLWFSGRLWVC